MTHNYLTLLYTLATGIEVYLYHTSTITKGTSHGIPASRDLAFGRHNHRLRGTRIGYTTSSSFLPAFVKSNDLWQIIGY